MVGRTVGHYEILAELGSGGMGVVYKAKDTRLDRLVAIKVLRPDAITDAERKLRFVQEARAASALNHPNIVTIHEIASDQGVEYIVMEYVQGRTLDRLIGSGGMKLRDLLNYAGQAADAIAKAHAAGIVHRDLKPSNLMVTEDGRVKILDFGLAKLARGALDSSKSTLIADPLGTGDGRVVGTPAYMSPEQAEGKAVDARSDIFSFGAVLYKMATGAPPFRGKSTASTLAAVLTATPPPPTQIVPKLPRDLDRIIVRCLRKDPSRRFQFMADLAVELEEIKTESSERIDAVSPASAPRSRWLWLVGGAAAAAILTVGAWRLWPRTTASGPPTIVPLTTYQGLESMPALSPDGTQVAFVWTGERQDNQDIYVKPVDAVTPLRLTTDPLPDVWPAWSPSGREIAFARIQADGRATIYVSPPIPGSERKLADVRQIDANHAFVPAPTWTPDGRWLLVADLADATGENGLFLIDVESGARRAIVKAPVSAVQYREPMISPAGDNLVYVACGAGGQAGCDLWIQPLSADFSTRGTSRALTTFHGVINGAAWAPDGRSVFMSVTTSQGSFTYLWRVAISGGEPTRLDWAGSQILHPAASRTGNRVAFTQEMSSIDIWRFDLTSPGTPPGTHPVSSTLADTDPEISPDGSMIAFASARSGQDLEIWVARLDGTDTRLLTRGAAGRNRGSPRWSHDGKRIAYDSSSADGVRRVYVMDATGGPPRPISDYPATFPSWSPRDDKWIYFSSNHSGRFEVWRVSSSGGTPEQITRDGGTAPRLSADGRTLYYRRETTLYAKPLAGGSEQAVVRGVFGVSSAYLPFGNDLFYVVQSDPSRPSILELRATDVRTVQVRTISRFEGQFASGLTVSPDGKTALLAVGRGGMDLMLIDNLR